MNSIKPTQYSQPVQEAPEPKAKQRNPWMVGFLVLLALAVVAALVAVIAQ